MADQNTQVSGTQDNGEATKEKRVTVQITEYATREECAANKPVGAEKDAWKCYQVTRPNKTVTWIWAVGSVNAGSTIARIDGYEVSLGERGPRTISQDAAMAALTPETLKSMGLSAKQIAAIIAARTAAKS